MSGSGRASPLGGAVRWVRSSRTLFRRVPDGVVVLLLPDGEPELLTGPGGQVWDLLGEPVSVDEIVDAIAPRYDHDPAVVRRDLEDLVAELGRRALIEVAA